MSAGAKYVLDTSAVLCLRGDELGAKRVETILRAAQNRRATVSLSFMTRMELLYRITRDDGAEAAAAAIRLLESISVDWVSCEPAILAEAAHLKTIGGLSVADAWIAATAVIHDAILVHKDPEFHRAAHIRQEQLR